MYCFLPHLSKRVKGFPKHFFMRGFSPHDLQLRIPLSLSSNLHTFTSLNTVFTVKRTFLNSAESEHWISARLLLYTLLLWDYKLPASHWKFLIALWSTLKMKSCSVKNSDSVPPLKWHQLGHIMIFLNIWGN